MAKKIFVKQVKSAICGNPSQKATLVALGLRKMNSVREHDDTKVIRGMINTVAHLVEVTDKK